MLHDRYDHECIISIEHVKENIEFGRVTSSQMEKIPIHTNKYWDKLHTLSWVMNIFGLVKNLKFMYWKSYVCHN